MKDVVEFCNDYLRCGGLFNSEHMDNRRVGLLILECRDEIERLREALLRTNDHAGAMADQARKLHRVEIIVQAEEGTQAERYERIKTLVMEQE